MVVFVLQAIKGRALQLRHHRHIRCSSRLVESAVAEFCVAILCVGISQHDMHCNMEHATCGCAKQFQAGGICSGCIYAAWISGYIHWGPDGVHQQLYKLTVTYEMWIYVSDNYSDDAGRAECFT